MTRLLAHLTAAFLLLAGAAHAIEPPAYSDPPPVAEDGYLETVISADAPLSVTQFREFLLRRPLISFLEPTENISPPATTEVLRGEWLQEGAVRRVQLEDGHYVIERILKNRPDLFKYQIWVFTNASGRGVEQIVGEQRFIGTGPNSMRFEWAYKVKPKSFLTRFFVSARMDEVTAFLSTGTDRMIEAAIAELGS